MRKFSVLTNVPLTNYYPNQLALEVFELSSGNPRDRFSYIRDLVNCLKNNDIYISLNPNIEDAIAAFLNKIILRRKSIVIFCDIILHKPVTFREKLIAKIKAILFHGVSHFLTVFKETSGYETYYGIPHSKFTYLPFKANNFEIASSFQTKKGDYVLACGTSHRDYKTFCRAIETARVPARIALPENKVAQYHQTFFELAPSADITVIRHDFEPVSWNELLANARFVVVPIKKGVIQSAGISVYLEAMAMGKAVLITEGASTRLMLDDQALIVPPGDAEEMAIGIRKLWTDLATRERFAKKGQVYALSLQGEKRFVQDIERNIIEFLTIK